MLMKNLTLIRSNWMRRLILTSLLFTLLVQLLSAPGVWASSASTTEDDTVLVVYSTASGMLDDSVKLLDLLVGQFSRHIVFREDSAATDLDLQQADRLIYYGGTNKRLPSSFVQLVAGFDGPVLAIGANPEQLGSRFSFLTLRPNVSVNRISKFDSETGEPVFQLLDVNYPIAQVELQRGQVLFEGWRGDIAFPLYARDGNNAYYASSDMDAPFSRYLSQSMADFFNKPLPSGHTAYIRLEDVHPMSDPKLLKQTGDYLADRGIPFIIALIPIYTNAETKEQLHLSDVPAIVDVLRHLQERGASIVLHGYTHQYRSSETGEGFEFWDVQNNTPIWGPSDQETKVKQRYEFSSKAEYDGYMQQLYAFEKQYIDARIQKGIRELTDLGLYPLGFEAPHYVMSETGYEIVSHYFNYILGQVQVSNTDWEHMGETAYASTPAFLHGMTLLPETIGYYDVESFTPETDFEQKIAKMAFIDGSMMGMFYHPYLGLDKLKAFISRVERIPNLTWLDLKKMNVSVRSPDIAISTDEQGRIQFTDTSPVSDTPQVVQSLRKLGAVQLVMWGIAVLVAVMVLLFFLYTLSMRMNLRKQLFEERRASG